MVVVCSDVCALSRVGRGEERTGEERCIQGFNGGNSKEGDHLKDTGVDGRIILKWIIDRWDGDVDWIDLA
jgi:hypothetical protein